MTPLSVHETFLYFKCGHFFANILINLSLSTSDRQYQQRREYSAWPPKHTHTLNSAGEKWPNPNPDILFLDGLLNTWAVDIATWGYYRRISKHSSQREEETRVQHFWHFDEFSTFVMKRRANKSFQRFLKHFPFSFVIHKRVLVFLSRQLMVF